MHSLLAPNHIPPPSGLRRIPDYFKVVNAKMGGSVVGGVDEYVVGIGLGLGWITVAEGPIDRRYVSDLAPALAKHELISRYHVLIC